MLILSQVSQGVWTMDSINNSVKFTQRAIDAIRRQGLLKSRAWIREHHEGSAPSHIAALHEEFEKIRIESQITPEDCFTVLDAIREKSTLAGFRIEAEFLLDGTILFEESNTMKTPADRRKQPPGIESRKHGRIGTYVPDGYYHDDRVTRLDDSPWRVYGEYLVFHRTGIDSVTSTIAEIRECHDLFKAMLVNVIEYRNVITGIIETPLERDKRNNPETAYLGGKRCHTHHTPLVVHGQLKRKTAHLYYWCRQGSHKIRRSEIDD